MIGDRRGGPLVVIGWGQRECSGDEYSAEALAAVRLVDTYLLEHRPPAWSAYREVEVGEGDGVDAQLQLADAAADRWGDAHQREPGVWCVVGCVLVGGVDERPGMQWVAQRAQQILQVQVLRL